MLFLATMPQDVGFGRRCGIWVSPMVRSTVILDTRAIAPTQWVLAGQDQFPPDSLLVIVSPEENHRLTQNAAALPYPTSGPMIAASIITEACRQDPALAARIGWHQRTEIFDVPIRLDSTLCEPGEIWLEAPDGDTVRMWPPTEDE